MDKTEGSGPAAADDTAPTGKVVLLHGFSAEEINVVLRAVKSAVEDPKDIAFAMTTPTNMSWRIRDFIADVRGDHEYLKANPPGKR
ncbi:MAG TPA: DUF3783 domain-containing protein [Spirochaetia bacterium]|nr:DUF3783 domain-containing protein [Spirochaetia bacterium]